MSAWQASNVSLGIPFWPVRMFLSDGFHPSVAVEAVGLQCLRTMERTISNVCGYSLTIRVSEYRFRPFKPTPIGQSKSGEAELIGTSIDTITKSPLWSPRSTPI